MNLFDTKLDTKKVTFNKKLLNVNIGEMPIKQAFSSR